MKRMTTLAGLTTLSLMMGTTTADAAAIAYWDFDSGTTDSVNGLTGTLQGGAALTAGSGGYTGEALNLTPDNTGDVMNVTGAQFVPYNPGFGSWSVSFWIKASSLGNGFVDHAGTNGYDIDGSGGNGIGLVLGSGGTGGVSWEVPSTTDVKIETDSTWHHVALTVDRTANRFNVYVDGVAAATNSYNYGWPNWSENIIPGTVGSINFSDTDLNIGAKNGNTSFQGYIDDYAIYDHALTAEEVGWLASGVATPDNLVPEPGSLALLGLGGLFMLRRRRS